MPFTLDDLERISVPLGMGQKTLRQMSDQQFMAWLRAHGASGEIGVVSTAPGHLAIPVEERVRVLNDLEQSGFHIPGVMGSPSTRPQPPRAEIQRLLDHLNRATYHLQEVQAAVDGGLGEVDPRVNMRASTHGALELVELMRGALEHARRAHGASSESTG
jgi:hypothetical protein